MSKYAPAPPLPRAPTVIRDVGADVWGAEAVTAVSWEGGGVAGVEETVEVAEDVKTPGFVERLRAIFAGKKGNSAEKVVVDVEEVPGKPLLVRGKELVCRLPDPTLAFVAVVFVVCIVAVWKPAALKTWAARILVPACLVPTVAASALWRRTRVISNVPEVPWFPVPDAGRVVSKGESLRAREAAVILAEDEIRKGQMRLEVLRKEIEGRLPPQVSIANLLDKENVASRAQTAPPAPALASSPSLTRVQ